MYIIYQSRTCCPSFLQWRVANMSMALSAWWHLHYNHTPTSDNTGLAASILLLLQQRSSHESNHTATHSYHQYNNHIRFQAYIRQALSRKQHMHATIPVQNEYPFSSINTSKAQKIQYVVHCMCFALHFCTRVLAYQCKSLPVPWGH